MKWLSQIPEDLNISEEVELAIFTTQYKHSDSQGWSEFSKSESLEKANEEKLRCIEYYANEFPEFENFETRIIYEEIKATRIE